MKLELKHLAPYLPYGLKMTIPHTIMKCELVAISFGDKSIEVDYPRKKNSCRGEILTFKDNVNRGHDSYIDNCKPILRPLSDMKGYLHKYKNEEYPILIEDGSIFLTDSCELNMLEITSNYKFYEFLFKNHFDLFGLIEKGLAIDANTLTPTK